ncbi:MAG: hypothetical protein ACREIF_10145 [Chthoniobacterales bacterium]
MLVSRKTSLTLAIVCSLTMGTAFPAVKSRSISPSRQFLVYGADLAIRGAMCDLAEQTKENLLRLLDQHDNWKTPIIISLDYPQANTPETPGSRLEVSQLGYGLKLQLNLLVTAEMEGRDVRRVLLRTVLIEMMYRERGNIAASMSYVAPPEWLLDGVLALQPGVDADERVQLLKTVVNSNKIAPLEDIVRQSQTQLDVPSRKLFDAYSEALVQLLLQAPGGKQKLAQFIADLPAAPTDEMANLCVHFPETLGRSPGKWWALSVAWLSAKNRYEILSAAETSTLLNHLLRFPITGPDGTRREYSLGDYESFCQLPGYRGALEQVGRQLLLLGARAHPFYRAIVQEDYELSALLVRGQARWVRGSLDRVARHRAVIKRQANQIADYLNWYEATQLKTMSGAFTNLLVDTKTADNSQTPRRDPISVYLDSIEMEMQ